MAEAFESFLEDFESCKADLINDLDAWTKEKHREKRQELKRKVTASVEDAERLLRLLDTEAKQGAATVKRKNQETVRHCRTELTKLKSEVEKVELLDDAHARKGAQPPAETLSAREQMDRYQQGLDRNADHLNEAEKTIAHTEAVANNIAQNLSDQRSHLEGAQLNMEQAQEDAEEAGGHLRRLRIKALTTKIVLILVILILVIAILLVAYKKWWPANHDFLHLIPDGATRRLLRV